MLGIVAIAVVLLLVQILHDHWVWSRAGEDHERLEVKLQESEAKQEAIVVLSGDYARIPKAVELIEKRGSALLLISGTGRGITLVDLIRRQGMDAQKIRAMWDRIAMESKSATTFENAFEAEPLLRKHQIRSVVLVTSSYHLARASEIFSRSFPDLQIRGYAVDSKGGRGWFRVAWRHTVEFWKYVLYHHRLSGSLLPDVPTQP